MNVRFRRSFERDLQRVADPRMVLQVKRVIERIEQAQALTEVANLTKLTGTHGYYRIRLGEYRVGLAVEGNCVTFVRFLHRKDIYRHFPED